MTEFNWNKFDNTIDTSALEDDIKEAESLSDYPEIPDGEYDVTVTHMELGQSKKKDNGRGGDPMMKITFRIMAGDFEGNLIFSNNVIQMWQPEGTRRFQIHNTNTMLRAIADNDDIKWSKFGELAKVIDETYQDVGTIKNDDGSLDEGWHYKLSQTTNTKNPDFKDLEILEILD